MPELDSTEFLDEEDTKNYQAMIGQSQWLVSLRRFDMQTLTMIMLAYRSKPRTGHRDRLKRMHCYVNKFSNYMIRFRTRQPDLLNFDTHKNQDLKDSVYGNHSEELPSDVPEAI